MTGCDELCGTSLRGGRVCARKTQYVVAHNQRPTCFLINVFNLLVVDSAKAAGVKLFVWSHHDSASINSSNKYHCAPFDAKYRIGEYLASSSIPHALVSPASFVSNMIGTRPAAPEKVGEGEYVLAMPASGKTVIPMMNVRRDFGAYVRAAIENPGMGAGSELLSGSPTTFEEMATALSECAFHSKAPVEHSIIALLTSHCFME